ncbi:MAG: metallophosphoesterase [Candidatus Magasanikbacteria bacterium]|nr:metallophosphoesterase [Candidatus Magasanikbacteria bacterium]
MALILAVILIKRKHKIAPIIIFLSIAGLIYSGYIEPQWIKIREQKIETNKLNEEVKVAVIGDWHFRPFKGENFAKRAIAKVAELKPDLILMTGDFLFFDDLPDFENDLRALGGLAKIAPTYTVLGNHDYGIVFPDESFLYTDSHREITKILEDSGIHVLSDEQKKVTIKGEEIILAGFDEYWRKVRYPEKTTKGLDKISALKIGISHHPDIAFEKVAENLDLVVAGHTHGGQVRLPLIGAIGDAESLMAKDDYGKYLPNHQPQIFNTVGIGESGPHLRFWNRPEIALLRIK